MDPRVAADKPASPSLSNPSPSNSASVNPSQSNPPLRPFPYNRSTSLSSLPSEDVASARLPTSAPLAPSTTLLPTAPHFRPLPHTPRSNPSPVSDMHRSTHPLPSERSTAPPPSAPSSHPLPHPRPSLPKLDSYQRPLPPPVMDRPDPIHPAHASQPAPLPSSSAQRYDLPAPRRQTSQEDHLRSQQQSQRTQSSHQQSQQQPQPQQQPQTRQQQPVFNQTATHSPLPQIQTRLSASSPLSGEPLPHISLPPTSQQMQPSLDPQPLRISRPRIQSIVTPPLARMSTASTEPTRGTSHPPSQKKEATASSKDTASHQARPRSQLAQSESSTERQRPLQPRQAPPLPRRPIMLAPPRASVVMQDVPRYQRNVVPSIPSHPSHAAHLRDMGPPGAGQQSATTVMHPSSDRLDSPMDQQHQSMYHGSATPPRRLSSIRSLVPQRPSSSALPGSSGMQRTIQERPAMSRTIDHSRLPLTSETQGEVSAYRRDLGRKESDFAQRPIAESQPDARAHRTHTQAEMAHPGTSRLGNPPVSDTPVYLNPPRQEGANATDSSLRTERPLSRGYEGDPMTVQMSAEGIQSPRTPQRTREGYSTSLPESSMLRTQIGRDPMAMASSVEKQTGIRSQAIADSGVRRAFGSQEDVAHHHESDSNVRDFSNSASASRIGTSGNVYGQRTTVPESRDGPKNYLERHDTAFEAQSMPRFSWVRPPDRDALQDAPHSINSMIESRPNKEDGFRGAGERWRRPDEDKERLPQQYATSAPSAEVRRLGQHHRPDGAHRMSTASDSTAKEVPPGRGLQALASQPRSVDEAGAPAAHQPIGPSQRSIAEGMYHALPFQLNHFVQYGPDKVDVLGRAHTAMDDEKAAVGVSSLQRPRDDAHAQLAGPTMTDSKKRADDKVDQTQQAPGGNVPGSGDENGGSQRRQLKVEDALAYLEKVKSQFSEHLSVYNRFLDIMKDFKADCIDTTEVIRQVSTLFQGHKDLILGFNTFLPPGYKIEVQEDEKTGILNTGFHGPEGSFNALSSHQKATAKSSIPKAAGKKGKNRSSPKRKDPKRSQNIPPVQVGSSSALPGSNKVGREIPAEDAVASEGKAASTKPTPLRKPIVKSQGTEEAHLPSSHHLQASSLKMGATEARAHEFERAIGFVTSIKDRFSDSPETFNAFLDALRRFREEQKSIREVFEAVADLFGPHKDLLVQFKEFIPTIAFSTLPDPRPGKGRGPPPFSSRGSYQKPISESTAHRKPPSANGKVKSRHRIRDMQFFEELKSRLGPERSHLYTEFIKCLSLFSQGIVSREELLHLTAEILQDDQDAHTSFLDYLETMATSEEGVFGGAEPQMSSSISSEAEPTAVDAARMAYYTSKPMSEIAAEAGVEQMHSYRRMPPDFPPCEYTGRSVQERRTLNDLWINVTTGSEDYSFKFMRRNQNEDNLFRCEDDRYELDLVIETNANTIMKLETIVATISRLPLGEKKRHALAPSALSPVHFNAIRRIYGDHGAEAVTQVKLNPYLAVPVVLKRLKEKDISWRRARMEMNRMWREVGERNFHRSLDHRSAHFKAVDKKDLSTKSLLMDVIDPAASVAARDAEMTRARGYAVENGGGGANHRSQALKAILAASKMASDASPRSLHLKFNGSGLFKVVSQLMMDVVDDVGCKKRIADFSDLAQAFFGLDEKKEGDSGQSKEAVLYGDDSLYVMLRLYHLLFERVTLAYSLAREQVADFKRRAKLNTEGEKNMASKGILPKISTKPWQLTKSLNTTEAENKFSLGPSTDNFEEICDQFLALAKQFARGKLDWTRYEDKCRTLLGVDSYGLVTIDKVLHKLIKSIDSVFSADSPSKEFCDLFHRCHQRLQEASCNGGKVDTEGIELLYSVAASRHLADVRNAGANLMRLQTCTSGDMVGTLAIHVIGQTGDDDEDKKHRTERRMVDRFLRCGDSQGSSEEHDGKLDEAEKSGSQRQSEAREETKIAGKGSRKRGNRGKDDNGAQKRPRKDFNFLKYSKSPSKVLDGLRNGTLVIDNGLEWRLDRKGVMQFSTEKCDYVFNGGRRRRWNEGLDAAQVNETCARSKKMREILRLVEGADSLGGEGENANKSGDGSKDVEMKDGKSDSGRGGDKDVSMVAEESNASREAKDGSEKDKDGVQEGSRPSEGAKSAGDGAPGQQQVAEGLVKESVEPENASEGANVSQDKDTKGNEDAKQVDPSGQPGASSDAMETGDNATEPDTARSDVKEGLGEGKEKMADMKNGDEKKKTNEGDD